MDIMNILESCHWPFIFYPPLLPLETLGGGGVPFLLKCNCFDHPHLPSPFHFLYSSITHHTHYSCAVHVWTITPVLRSQQHLCLFIPFFGSYSIRWIYPHFHIVKADLLFRLEPINTLIFLSLPGYTYKKENISFILQFQHLFLIPKLDNTQGKKK